MVVGRKAELDVTVVFDGVVTSDVAVMALAPGPADPAEIESAAALVVVVVVVPLVVISEDMVICFFIYKLKFSSDYFNEHE